MQLRFIKCLFKGYRLHFFMAPGPSGFSSRPKAVIRSFVNLTNMLLARLSGGTVHIVGRAYRGKGISRVSEIAAIRIANSVAVRDELSNIAIGGRGETLPDLAFSGQRYLGAERKYVAISVREEDELSPEMFDSLVSGIRAFGAVPILVTQVRRDNDLMRKIASRAEVKFLMWSDNTSHVSQRHKVEEIYRLSYAIISNRLHGLIMATMAGAAPIPLIASNNTKLLPTMKVVLPDIAHVQVSQLTSICADEWMHKLHCLIVGRDAVTEQLQRASKISEINFHNITKNLVIPD